MDRMDFEVLEEMLDVVEQIHQAKQIWQRLGNAPKRSNLSLSRKLRRDVCVFAETCRRGELNGRSRKRKSGELFRRIIALHPDVWSK